MTAKIIIHPKAIVFDRSGEIKKREGISMTSDKLEEIKRRAEIVAQSKNDFGYDIVEGERWTVKEFAEANLWLISEVEALRSKLAIAEEALEECGVVYFPSASESNPNAWKIIEDHNKRALKALNALDDLKEALQKIRGGG